jgi:uncharacterized protein YtpQ (UPF0354 family)
MKRICQLLCAAVLVLQGVTAHADALTDRVVAAFKQENPKLDPTIKAESEILLTAPIGTLTVYLDRIRAECTKRPEDCDSFIKGFVHSTATTAVGPDYMKFDVENVYPVVRPEGLLREMRSKVGNDASHLLVSKPYVSGAVLLYAIDTPKAVRFVSAADLDAAGLTVGALDKLALAHVSRLPPLKVEPTSKERQLWAALATDGYGTSRLFDSKFWDALEARAGGPVAVALPTRDWLLAARLDDQQAIAQLRTVASRIVAGEPTAVTAALVRRDGNGWREVPP